MTDKEHYDEIKAAALALGKVIDAAFEVGLEVRCSVDTSDTYTPGRFRKVRVHDPVVTRTYR